jgi:hypothetical protein
MTAVCQAHCDANGESIFMDYPFLKLNQIELNHHGTAL